MFVDFYKMWGGKMNKVLRLWGYPLRDRTTADQVVRVILVLKNRERNPIMMPEYKSAGESVTLWFIGDQVHSITETSPPLVMDFDDFILKVYGLSPAASECIERKLRE